MLVTAVLVGVSEGGYSIGEMEVAVLVTAIVFALAHGWAGAMQRSAERGEPFRVGMFRASVDQEWAMVRVTTPTAIALGLAWAGAWSAQTGINVAIVANLALLFIWGVALDQRAGADTIHAVGAGAVAVVLGLSLVVLKVLVH